MRSYITALILETQHVMAGMLADDTLLARVETAAEACIRALSNGGKILLAGNGGSAADAQHIAGEFVSRFAFDRPGLPAIASGLIAGLLKSSRNVVPLARGEPGCLTASHKSFQGTFKIR